VSDKVGLGRCVGHAITVMCLGEPDFETAVLPGNVRMLNEIVPEQESVPVLKMALDHVDVMRSVPALVTLYEPGVERR